MRKLKIEIEWSEHPMPKRIKDRIRDAVDGPMFGVISGIYKTSQDSTAIMIDLANTFRAVLGTDYWVHRGGNHLAIHCETGEADKGPALAQMIFREIPVLPD